MAYITQYEADMRGDAKNSQNQAAIGNAFINGLQSMNENRRRALDAKRMQEEKKFAFVKDGNSEEDAEAAVNGDLKGVSRFYAGINEAKRDEAAREKLLNNRLKESTIAANEAAATDKSKPFEESRAGQEYKAKMALEEKQRNANAKTDMNRDIEKDFTKRNIQLASVKTAMDSAYSQLQDPNKSEEEKIKIGQGLLKLLNSAEGADAVGAEESKRIGGYLEYQMGNFTQPGKFIGRDLDGFAQQVRNNSELLADRIKRNEQTATGVLQGQPMSQVVAPPKAEVPAPIAQKIQTMNPDQKLKRLQELQMKKQRMQALNGGM